MKPLLFAFATAAALLGGCSSVPTISVSSHSPTPAVYERGTAVFRAGEHCGIAVRQLSPFLSYEVLEWPALEVTIVNNTPQTLDLSAACFAAYSGTKKVPVLLYDDYAEQIRSAMSVQGIHQFMQSSGTLLTSMRTPASNRPTASGAVSISAANLTNAMNAREQVQSRKAAAQIAYQRPSSAGLPRNIEWHLGSMLRPIQLAPGDSVRGNIRFDAWTITTGRPLRLVVTVAGETHEIVLDIGR